MLHTQPFYVAGIDDVESAETSAFGAMGMFLFTFVASIFGIWYDSQHKAEPIVDGSDGDHYHSLAADHPPATYGTAT